jgi:hypothetical protein
VNRLPVASSNIKSVGYEDGTMQIEFTNGRVYAYTGAKAKEHFDALVSAPSAGKYFAAHVRQCPHTSCSLVSG